MVGDKTIVMVGDKPPECGGVGRLGKEEVVVGKGGKGWGKDGGGI